jgi:hypothetical protein
MLSLLWSIALISMVISISILLTYAFYRIKEKQTLSKIKDEEMFFEANQNNDQQGESAKDVNKYILNLVTQEELVVKDIIGFGAFGTVHRGYYVPLADPQKRIKVAIKIMNPSKRTDEKNMIEITKDLMNVK